MSQRKFEKIVLQILVSVILSVVCWVIVNNYIVPVAFLNYIFIEFLLLFAFRLYIFVAMAIGRIAD